MTIFIVIIAHRSTTILQAWLDKIDRRYAWFKRMMTSYRETCVDIFPEEWNMPNLLARRFCNETKKQLKDVLKTRESELDVQVLLFAIKKTTHFESLLNSKFGIPAAEVEKTSQDNGESNAPATFLTSEDEALLEQQARVRILNYKSISSNG